MFFFCFFFTYFCGYIGFWNYVSKNLRGKGCNAPKLWGNGLRGPKLCVVKVEGSKTPRGKCAFNLCPVEFWTPQPLPHGKQCNLGPVEFWRHSFTKNIWKLNFLFHFKVFCKTLTFQTLPSICLPSRTLLSFAAEPPEWPHWDCSRCSFTYWWLVMI